MFGAIRRTFGLIKVTETDTLIQVSGVPADILARDIAKIWNTQRINLNMFTSVNRNGFSFPKFFAIEVHYMLQQIDEYRYSKSSVRTIRHLLAEMEEHTWLKRLTEEHESRVDLTQLSRLNAKLFQHQDSFVKGYGELVEQYDLDGYLLSAEPGTGKTIMGLALAECLHADLIVVVSPKNALHRVWTSTIDWLYKKPQKYWVAASGMPYHRERIIVTHYEALAKALEAAKTAPHQRAVIILDESHNLNEAKSNRTQLFLELCKTLKSRNVLWSSGTPLKAMGYEMVPLLRSIDPHFTDDVEKRFLKIFGKASDRALDILRNRIGKISYHVSGAEVINVEKSYSTWKIEIPNADEYTLDSIRERMRKFVDERLAHYKKNFRDYQKAYDAGVDAYVKVMNPDDRKNFKRYIHAVRQISRGYDPKLHKDEAVFANDFEQKKIIPAISDKKTRDGFKDARSVVKYAHLKVLGEALGSVVGKARSQCQIDMAKHTDWAKIADMSEKKVIVFTSYVDVVKAVEEDVRKAGYKSLLVYGDTNANVAGLVNRFGNDSKIKFMIATFQSLSTAVPLTMADVTVFTNTPFRSFEQDQAEARTARIGQDTAVKYVTTLLDTGSKPNISTRSHDILAWSREQVEAMMGSDLEGVAAQLNKDYLAGAMEAFKYYGDTPFPTLDF